MLKNLTKATTIKDKVVRTDNISLFKLKVINAIVTIRIIAMSLIKFLNLKYKNKIDYLHICHDFVYIFRSYPFLC